MATIWTGGGNSTAWSDAANWSPSGAPSFVDVQIPGTAPATTVDIASSDNFGETSIALGSSSSTDTAILNNAGTLAVNSDMNVTLGGTFNTSGTYNGFGSTSIAGTFDNSGTASISGLGVASTGTLETTSTGATTVGSIAGGNPIEGSIIDNGSLTINAGITIGSTGSLTVAHGATANLTSTLEVDSGGIVTLSGATSISSSIGGAGSIVVDGGTVTGASSSIGVTFDSGASTQVTIENGGSFFVNNAPPTNVSFAFGPNDSGTFNVLKVPDNIAFTQPLTNSITGFGPGDEITTGATNQTGTVTDNGDGSYTITLGGVIFTDVRLAPGVTPDEVVFHSDGSITVCFVEGTLIHTDRGDVPVENLQVGDLVATRSGEFRQIRWIGSRRIDLATCHEPELIAPVRVSKDAIGENIPARDLLVSPDHGLYIEGSLVPAHQLLNGTTITQDLSRRTFRYFHVELESHDLLVAEGLAAESYLDTGNRNWFSNQGPVSVLRPDCLTVTCLASPPIARTDGMRMTTEPETVKPIWLRLQERAATMGEVPASVSTTCDPMLRLLVDGRWIKPIWINGDDYLFPLDSGAQSIRLISRAARASDLAPWSGDRRMLGVAVARLNVYAGSHSHAIDLGDDRAFSDGWWALERQDRKSWRWTDGNGLVRLLGTNARFDYLSVQLQGTLNYRTAPMSEMRQELIARAS